MSLKEFSTSEKAKMLLSAATLNGIRMTGNYYTHINLWIYTCQFYIVTSFLELGPLLLQDRNVKSLLAERFCQDS